MQVDVQYIPITAKISGKNPSGLASFWNLNSMVGEKSNLDCIYGLRKDYNKTLVVMQINDSCMNEIYKEVLFPFFLFVGKRHLMAVLWEEYRISDDLVCSMHFNFLSNLHYD